MILVRLLSYLRRHWPRTHLQVRGDSHFATPEVIEVMAHRRFTDFIFGVAGHAVLLREAAPIIQEALAGSTLSSTMPSAPTRWPTPLWPPPAAGPSYTTLCSPLCAPLWMIISYPCKTTGR